MMYHSLIFVSLFMIASVLNQAHARPAIALERRRFGVQNPTVVALVAGFSDGRDFVNCTTIETCVIPSAFPTFAKQMTAALTAAGKVCDQIRIADLMTSFARTHLQGQNQKDFIDLAREFAHAEKEFNPDVTPTAPACPDPSLPGDTNPELYGVLPLQDPSVPNGNATNELTTNQLNAIRGGKSITPKGLSIAQQLINIGFTPSPIPAGSPT